MSAWDPTTAPDTALGLLSNARRRSVVKTIAANGGMATRQALVKAIVEDETGESIADAKTGCVQEAHISLYHCHLPKLSQHGIVDHNRETGEVVLSDDGEALKAAVETAEDTIGASRKAIEDFYR
ncbi:DUF7344 domain-containing protein [Halomarina pelagica]|uniref:DUF7344 domain-containing protein n=1 Tax=Halomarina pelagica TaxID=2961599 RepID=UPI0020C38051|nr:hypothetical protein [Halomarina sp. BND7]